MTLTNIYIRPDIPDESPRVQLHTLKWGQRYKHSHNGPVSQIFFIGPEWITIRRADDWLVRVTKEMEGFNKRVIVV